MERKCFRKTVEMGELAQFNFINASKMFKTYRPYFLQRADQRAHLHGEGNPGGWRERKGAFG